MDKTLKKSYVQLPKKELEIWDQIKARERNSGLDLQIEEFLKTSDENGAEVYGEEHIEPRIFELDLSLIHI